MFSIRIAGLTLAAVGVNVRIEHCKLASRTFGVYIKTRIGRAGTIDGILGEDIDVLSGGFLRVNLISAGNLNTSDDPVEGPLGYPSAKNLQFSNVRLKDATVMVEMTQIAEEKPVLGFSLSNISGTAAKGMILQHVRDAALTDIKVAGVSGPLLSTNDVTGTGLEGAVPYVSPPRANSGRTPPDVATSNLAPNAAEK